MARISSSVAVFAAVLALGAVLVPAADVSISNNNNNNAADANNRFFPEKGAQLGRVDWNTVGPAPRDIRLKVHIGMNSRNAPLLKNILLDISNPKSENYGKYLTNEQVTQLVSTPPEEVNAIAAWLVSEGVDKKDIQLVGNQDLLSVTAPITVIEKLFGVEMMVLESILRPGMRIVRSKGEYSIPATMAAYIVFVEGLHRTPNVRVSSTKVQTFSRKQRQGADWPDTCGSTCHNLITPQVLIQRYNVTRRSSGYGSQAVAEFQGQDLDPKDLAQFQSICGLPNQPVNQFVGPNSPSTGIESGLDIEYILGVAPGVNTTFWSLADYSLYNWIEQVASNSNPPLVHSVSYGNDEAQNGKAYMDKTNTEFTKMGARGITVLFASGDQGVWGRAGVFDFHPDFPAASPYITSVGATQFPGSSIAQEECTNWSGGGFSHMFEPLPFSVNATQQYFQTAGKTLPPHIFWNNKGNGYPVLSANGGANQQYCVIVGGAATGVAGTSASCPVMAAMLALANDIRISLGKSPLGFVNPLIFSLLTDFPQAFDDITKGRNSAGKIYGFSATQGWDPCSGVGNLNFAAFASYISKNLK